MMPSQRGRGAQASACEALWAEARGAVHEAPITQYMHLLKYTELPPHTTDTRHRCFVSCHMPALLAGQAVSSVDGSCLKRHFTLLLLLVCLLVCLNSVV